MIFNCSLSVLHLKVRSEHNVCRQSSPLCGYAWQASFAKEISTKKYYPLGKPRGFFYYKEEISINMKNLDEKIKQKIVSVISVLIPEAKIYLFGSRARGTNSERADIDIALDADKPLLPRDVDEVKSMFKESNIMYKIDVVDFHQISELMRNEILRERVLWSNTTI
jgi:predicted nucleotidyltransferase